VLSHHSTLAGFESAVMDALIVEDAWEHAAKIYPMLNL